MAIEVMAGSRWQSAVCETQVIVVRVATGPIDLECGGHPMLAHGEPRPEGLSLDPAHAAGTPMGKRYADEATGVELLCTKAGAGSLSIGGVAVPLKDAKPLPASD